MYLSRTEDIQLKVYTQNSILRYCPELYAWYVCYSFTMTYYVYVVECSDGTLYCGYTNDITGRLESHNTSRYGAKYTRGRRPVRLVYSVECVSKSAAMKEEARIKKLPRKEKEKLVLKKPI